MKKNYTPVQRFNEALAYRSNSSIQPRHGLPLEQVVRSDRNRYIDPLVKNKLEYLSSANDRERVSAQDPLACMVTWGFAMRGMAKYPKFYANDQMDAPEVGIATRELLKQINYHLMKISHHVCELIHGWALTEVWTDEYGQLKWNTYGEHLIRPEDIYRNPLDAREMVMWRVAGRYPILPLGRSQTRIIPERKTLVKGQPGLIYTTRGDPRATWGYGIARLEAGWDSITKLRLESHANAFRSQIFAQVIHPPEWDDAQCDDFWEVLSQVDQTNGLMVPAAVNDLTGDIVPEIPAITFRTLGDDARSKSDSGSSGMFSNLSSEFVRFCGIYKLPINEVTGNPGGAIESADVDAIKALQEKITEWNLSRDFDIQFIEFLRASGIPVDLPPSFVVKCHWQWEMDEMMQQEAEMAEREMQATEQDAQQKRAENVALSKNIMDMYLGTTGKRMNAPPAGIMMPITSSWVKSYGWGDATGVPGNQGDVSSLYLQFHGSQATFEYPGVSDPEKVATEIEMSGSPGGFVHDHRQLGVPARTPYKKTAGPGGPGTMSAFGAPQDLSRPEDFFGSGSSTAHVDTTSEAQRLEKTAAFGSLRPAGPAPQTMYSKGAQTEAATESTTRHFTGTTADLDAMADIQSALAIARGDQPAGPGSSDDAGWHSGVDMYDLGDATGTSGFQGSGGMNVPNVPRGRGRPVKQKTGVAGRPRKMPSRVGTTETAGVANVRLPDYMESYKRYNDHCVALTGKGASKTTFTRERAMMDEWIKRENSFQFRENAWIGNSMNFDIPLHYRNDDGTVRQEYACKRDWKQNMRGEFPLWLYHGGPEIGTITYNWDNENDMPLDTLDYDKQEVMSLLQEMGKTSNRLYLNLEAGITPEQSTEYYCRTEEHDGRVFQRDFRPIGAALVDFGNCGTGKCDFTPAA
jgi:hypothetical protein